MLEKNCKSIADFEGVRGMRCAGRDRFEIVIKDSFDKSRTGSDALLGGSHGSHTS
jgi:hypothetical protein